MLNVGPLELMVILLVALIVVGPKKLPEIGRQIGRGLREFKKVQDEVRDSIQMNLDDETPPRVPVRDATAKPPETTTASADGGSAPSRNGEALKSESEEPGPSRGAPDDGEAAPASDRDVPE